jgi:DNA-damage-inducible protein J
MSQNDVVRARIDGDTKQQAMAVLDAMGLTISDAFRMMVKRIATEQALPFDPLVPNDETVAAMKAARQGETHKADDMDTLFQELNAPD